MSEQTVKNHANSRKTALTVSVVGILSAMAFVLMYLEISLPLMPVFLKFDFSEIPVLVGSFALGPVYGILIELIKNLLHLPFTSTGGVGEFSNFIVGSCYALAAGIWYTKHRTKKGAVIALIIATVVLAAIACPFNYFVTLPLYEKILGLPIEAIIGMGTEANSAITTKLNLIIYAFLPFNIFKGIVVGFITFWIYKPISNLINSIRKKIDAAK